MRPRARVSSLVAAALMTAALVAGCGSESPTAPDTSPMTDQPAPANVTVVTVPALPDVGAPGWTVLPSPPNGPASDPGSAVIPEVGDAADPTNDNPNADDHGAESDAEAGSDADAGDSGTDDGSGSGDHGNPAPDGDAPGADADSPASPSSPMTANTSPAEAPSADDSSASPQVAVDMSKCADCTVLAVAPDVRGGLAVTLAADPRGAVLLATRPDGVVVGVINVPYGVAFAAPPHGVLPCDSAGRCFVVAAQADGTAIVSAFSMDASGQLRDVTAAGGFRSGTAAAVVADVTGDGRLDVAVQAVRSAGPIWVVHTWSADRFVVAGCAASPAAPTTAADLSLAACSG